MRKRAALIRYMIDCWCPHCNEPVKVPPPDLDYKDRARSTARCTRCDGSFHLTLTITKGREGLQGREARLAREAARLLRIAEEAQANGKLGVAAHSYRRAYSFLPKAERAGCAEKAQRAALARLGLSDGASRAVAFKAWRDEVSGPSERRGASSLLDAEMAFRVLCPDEADGKKEKGAAARACALVAKPSTDNPAPRRSSQR